MKIILKTSKKSDDSESKASISKDIVYVHSLGIKLDVERLSLLSQLEHSQGYNIDIQNEIKNIESQMNLLNLNLSILRGREAEFDSDELVTGVSRIEFCCPDMKSTIENGEVYCVNKKDGSLLFYNGSFAGEVFLSDDTYEIHFCPYCGEEVEKVQE